MKHTYSHRDIQTAKAIIRIFETGDPIGNYTALAVLNDGAGISYGINQFTHRSGSLLKVVKKYFENGGVVGKNVIDRSMGLLARNDAAAIDHLAKNTAFKKALQAAAVTAEMRDAQEFVGEQMYLKPALNACDGSGFKLPLSLAVIYDSLIHGSYAKIRDRVKMPQDLSGEIAEKAWVTSYVRERDRWLGSIVRLRATRYRTRFFLEQIAVGRWHLEMPLTVHGTSLTEHSFNSTTAEAAEVLTLSEPKPLTNITPNMTPASFYSADDPAFNPGVRTSHANLSQTGSDRPCSYCGKDNTGILDDIEGQIDKAAGHFDRIERMTYSVTTRTDRAKSLWTTVVATVWQTSWAVFGLAAGLPREVWLVVAIFAGAAMLTYLYRQIALGKIRETENAKARV